MNANLYYDYVRCGQLAAELMSFANGGTSSYTHSFLCVYNLNIQPSSNMSPAYMTIAAAGGSAHIRTYIFRRVCGPDANNNNMGYGLLCRLTHPHT